MRVLVATDGIGGLDSLAAGQALAAGWAEAGHQVAVVPLATGGPALERAVAALAGGRSQCESHCVRRALRAREVRAGRRGAHRQRHRASRRRVAT